MSKLSIVRISDFYRTFTIIQTLTQSSVSRAFCVDIDLLAGRGGGASLYTLHSKARILRRRKKPHESMNPYSPNNSGVPQTAQLACWFQVPIFDSGEKFLAREKKGKMDLLTRHTRPSCWLGKKVTKRGKNYGGKGLRSSIDRTAWNALITISIL